MAKLLIVCLFAGALAALACLLYGFLVEPKRLEVRELSIPANVPSAVRIGVLTDTHAGGKGVDAARMAEVRAALVAGAPDMVLLAGDYLVDESARRTRSDAQNRAVEAALDGLAGLADRAPVFAVLGNHDHWYGAAWVRERLRDYGFDVIDNDVREHAGVCVVGLGDEWEDVVDMDTFNLCPPGKPRVVVTHNPDTLLRTPHGFAVGVAGHTHGGQINLPVVGRLVTAIKAPRRFAYGLNDAPGGPVYTSSGIGMSVMPARFRSPPEIVFITLVPQDTG